MFRVVKVEEIYFFSFKISFTSFAGVTDPMSYSSIVTDMLNYKKV